MKNKKRIGILGGISHESTIEYYHLIHKKYFEHFGNYYYPEIVIFSLDFQKFTDTEKEGQEDMHLAYMMEGIQALEKAGADFIIMAANSPHAYFERVQKQTKVPMISIAEVTAKRAKEKGMKKLLLTGIKFTMQSRFYPDVCAKYEIQVVTPSDAQQDEIDNLIFQELCRGKFTDQTKQKLISIINQYDVDGVILGCTELPLILKDGDGKVPFLSTVDIHAEAALVECLK